MPIISRWASGRALSGWAPRFEGRPVTSFEAKFPAYFASSRTLHIARGKVPVERLDLDGSGAAVAELRRCVAAQRDDGRAARRPRGDDIPRDPFAAKRK